MLLEDVTASGRMLLKKRHREWAISLKKTSLTLFWEEDTACLPSV